MKNHFAINPYNQLLIKPKGAKKIIPVNGRLSIQDNQLIYYINEPVAWHREYDLGAKIRFSGRWQLNPNYDLQLVLNETRTQRAGERLIINAKIISAEDNCLVFQAISKKADSRKQGEPGLYSFCLLKLLGTWQADEYNQLSFVVKKDLFPDILIFQGAWEINQNQKIIYTYERRDLRTKAKVFNTLAFEGFWAIGESKRLRYVFSESSDSYFYFRLQIESENIYPSRGVIKYRIGIGVSTRNRRPREKIISLFGTWRFSRSLGLLFEVDYGEGELGALEFGADVVLSSKDKFTFYLKSQVSQPLGVKLIFTHRFLKKHDAEAFVRLEKLLGKEDRAELGVRIPF